MKTAMMTRLIRTVRTALSLDTGLWTGRFASPETRAMAEASLASLNAKVERLTRVLHLRYEVDLRYTKATEIASMVG